MKSPKCWENISGILNISKWTSVTCSQIWLSSFVDDCQNTVLTKLGKKKTLARTLLVVSDFFWLRILAILPKKKKKLKKLKKEYFVTNSFFFGKRGSSKFEFFNKNFASICDNCLQYERVLKIFYHSYFQYSQIWLNILMDDGNLSKI